MLFLLFLLFLTKFLQAQRLHLRKIPNWNQKFIQTLKFNAGNPVSPEYLKNFMNSQYYGVLSLGSPPQEFNFLFDTGSSDVWVISKSCSWYSIPCMLHVHKYDHNESQSYKPLGEQFVIPYAQGNVTAFLSNDKFQMGNILIQNQIFGEANKIPISFIGMMFDGIVGLGFYELSEFKQNPFFYNLLDQYPDLKPIFSVYLGNSNQDQNQNQDFQGEILFGDIDPKLFHGNLISHNVVSDHYWAIVANEISYNNYAICHYNCYAVIDTGTSLIIGPSIQVDTLNKQLGSTSSTMGIAILDCNKVNNLGNVTFRFDNTNYVLTKDDYVLKIGTLCTSVFVGKDLFRNNKHLWILGDVFLRKYYSVFDLKHKTISFAPSVTNYTPNEYEFEKHKKKNTFIKFEKYPSH